MKAGDRMLAPGWAKGLVFYEVAVQARVKNGLALVRWVEGPLAGREARLDAKTLKQKETTR